METSRRNPSRKAREDAAARSEKANEPKAPKKRASPENEEVENVVPNKKREKKVTSEEKAVENVSKAKKTLKTDDKKEGAGPSTVAKPKKEPSASKSKAKVQSKSCDDIPVKKSTKVKIARRSRSVEPLNSKPLVPKKLKKAAEKDSIPEETSTEAPPPKKSKAKKGAMQTANRNEEDIEQEINIRSSPIKNALAKIPNSSSEKVTNVSQKFAESSEEEARKEEVTKKSIKHKTVEKRDNPSLEEEQATASAAKGGSSDAADSEDGAPPAKKGRSKKAASEKSAGSKNAASVTEASKVNAASSEEEPPKDEVTKKSMKHKTVEKRDNPSSEEEQATASAAKDESSDAVDSDDGAPPAKKGRSKKAVSEKSAGSKNAHPVTEASTSQDSKKLLNKVDTNYSEIDFNIKEKFNFKISMWNVAGLRALVKKNSSYFEHENADVVCLNELKCGSEKEIPVEAKLNGYHAYWNIGKAAPGVGLLSKTKPLKVWNDIPESAFDDDKRMITAEYKDFFLVAVYVVNAGRGLKTLDKRLEWNEAFDSYIQGLDKKKPVVIAGDMNVAHEEVDLTNPSTNKKNAGFTQEERDGFSKLLSFGFVDTYRHFHPDETGAYTFWSYMNNARAKNVGWRLDYFVVSQRFMNHVKANVIRSAVLGSDHCPIVLFLNL